MSNDILHYPLPSHQKRLILQAMLGLVMQAHSIAYGHQFCLSSSYVSQVIILFSRVIAKMQFASLAFLRLKRGVPVMPSGQCSSSPESVSSTSFSVSLAFFCKRRKFKEFTALRHDLCHLAFLASNVALIPGPSSKAAIFIVGGRAPIETKSDRLDASDAPTSPLFAISWAL